MEKKDIVLHTHYCGWCDKTENITETTYNSFLDRDKQEFTQMLGQYHYEVAIYNQKMREYKEYKSRGFFKDLINLFGCDPQSMILIHNRNLCNRILN